MHDSSVRAVPSFHIPISFPRRSNFEASIVPNAGWRKKTKMRKKKSVKVDTWKFMGNVPKRCFVDATNVHLFGYLKLSAVPIESIC